MEAMRASPRASGARRVLARKRGRPDDASANTARKLQRREVAAGPGRAFSPSFKRERFRNIQLQEEFDTHDPLEKSFFLLHSLRTRSAVREIFGAQDIIFALSHSGVCAALSRVTKQRICFLNGSPDEEIINLFYNKGNESIITVSAYASEGLDNLFCRTTPIEYIRQAMPGAGLALFEEELLNGKSYVEVDDVNGKVLIYLAQDSIYKVFDWETYTLLYTISDKNIWKIKFCPGILVLIYRNEGYISLEVRSIEDNKSLRSLKHLIRRTKPIEFIEQFDEKLFIKQKGEDLQILNIRNFNLAEVSRKEFVNPTSVIFLQRLQMLLTLHGRIMSVWNCRGERVTCFEDNVLWYPKCNTEIVSITSNQDLIVSYCRADPNDPSSDGNACSINISELLTGKCLAKIKAADLCKQKKALKFQKTPSEALRDITALYYDEEHEEIYTGNAEGLVHMWSS